MRLSIVSLVLMMVLALSARAAEPTGFDLGFARPGMTVSEFRQAFDNKNIKVVCTRDAEKPQPIDAAALAVDEAWIAAGIERCRHFIMGKKVHRWEPVLVKIGDVCCVDLFVDIVEDGGIRRVARINARVDGKDFFNLLLAFSVQYGPANQFSPTNSTWHGAGQTANLRSTDDAGYLVIDDDALRSQWVARTGKIGTKGQ